MTRSVRDNNHIFQNVWNTANKYGLSFISSNGGTGKTTYFKFRLLHDAFEKNIPFHIFVRFSNQMEIMAHSFIDAKSTYSRRQLDLLHELDVYKENDKFIYIISKSDGRKIAQILNINGQSYYKPFGNTIHARRALFDEVLAENGDYCPDEINKFNRLVFTMARADDYKVFCLYNNSNPSFDYFTFYGGKNYHTHVARSGALFLYFTAKQYSASDSIADEKSIQSIIQNTAYNDVYNNNSFIQYPTFFLPMDLRGASTLFKIEIENRIFKIRERDGYIFLDDKFALKRNHKPIYSANDPIRTKIKQIPNKIKYALSVVKDKARLKTTDINNTIFCKILSERV